MPVSNLLMLLLNLTKPNSNPYGPKNSIEPLSKTLVVCPPHLSTILVIYLL